jgi:hypothetical protein
LGRQSRGKRGAKKSENNPKNIMSNPHPSRFDPIPTSPVQIQSELDSFISFGQFLTANFNWP